MKQTVEEAAKEYADNLYEPTDRGILYRETQKDFIAGADWQAKQSPWISVKERLPNENEIVLCRMKSNGAIVSGYIFISPEGYACVSTSPNFEFEDYGGYECDMWMPIPKFIV